MPVLETQTFGGGLLVPRRRRKVPDELRAACGRPRWVALALAMLVMGARASQPDAGMLTAIADGTKLVSYGQVLGPVSYEVLLPEHRTAQLPPSGSPRTIA